MQQRAHFVIHGRVQGVCYRMCARDEAHELGVVGWVRNQSDGTVEALAEGDEQQIRRFLAWCREGPPWACVNAIDESYSEPTGEFEAFRVVF